MWGEPQTQKRRSAVAHVVTGWQKNAAGRLRQEIGEGWSGYRQGSHFLFYTVAGDIVSIIGMPHGSMDVDACFSSPA
jgi:hypothetical protein